MQRKFTGKDKKTIFAIFHILLHIALCTTNNKTVFVRFYVESNFLVLLEKIMLLCAKAKNEDENMLARKCLIF